MPFSAHRARPGHHARESIIVGALLVVVAVTGVSVVQLVSDDAAPATAQDGAVASPAPYVAPDPARPVRARRTPEASADPAPQAEPTATSTSVAQEREARKRLDAAVRRRSAALNQLVALAQKKAAQDEAAATAPFSVTVGSFNVLGSQHTAPGGDRPSFPPASVRSAGAVNRMLDHGVDIVGMQELQDDQLRTLLARTGMAAYPGFAWGTAETDNSILYDPSRFEFVSGDRFTIPFMGRPRPQPILRLRERTTGREFYVVNTHPSAHDGPYLAERRQGQAMLVSVVNNLKQSGLPILVTGDMNDRELFYCNVVPQAGLVASNGGSYASGCSPPPGSIPVDWVVGSGVTWSGYRRDTTPVTSRISDHFFISAVATFG